VIGKKKLIEGVEKAMEIQKRLVLHLNRHIASAVTHGSLGGEQKEKMLEKFQEMAVTHTKHFAALESIMEEIKNGETNVY